MNRIWRQKNRFRIQGKDLTQEVAAKQLGIHLYVLGVTARPGTVNVERMSHDYGFPLFRTYNTYPVGQYIPGAWMPEVDERVRIVQEPGWYYPRSRHGFDVGEVVRVTSIQGLNHLGEPTRSSYAIVRRADSRDGHATVYLPEIGPIEDALERITDVSD